MGMRQTRMADEIRDAIGSWFSGGRLNDPRLEGVTVTAVELSGDLQIATVFYRSYADLDDTEIRRGLAAVTGLLRRDLGRHLDVRRIPELKFRYDASVDHAQRINQLLSEVRAPQP